LKVPDEFSLDLLDLLVLFNAWIHVGFDPIDGVLSMLERGLVRVTHNMVLLVLDLG
jgi:hypothetical protein